MQPLFDSRNDRYRCPFGAVAEGTAVLFRVRLPRSLGCSAVRLLTAPDGAAETAHGLFWAGMDGDAAEWWECHFAPPERGLYWYRFALTTAHGERWLERQPDGKASLSATAGGRPWQLTAYAADFTTPDWLAGGVMYQIFPDRFARSGAPKEGVPEDRILRTDWGGQPAWQPDADGKIRNNDYFGGDLRGIEQALDRLAMLGVTCLYLNPVFEAHSNHRYDTADYTRIDPLLGSEADFASLVRTAAQLGIRVLLDGVFSHTGADSRYFNQQGRYPDVGAYQSQESPYAPWYQFRRWPDDFVCWWDILTLPTVDKSNPDFLRYITGEDGVARRWLAAGAAGWRLDVADELTDAFLDALRTGVKAQKPDALLLGEVWEDASNKESYGRRRRYLLGDQLDSVMNYPFRNAVLAFLRGGVAQDFFNIVSDIVENYPPQVVRLLMNHLGTHDTERLLTALAGEPCAGRGRDWQAATHLTAEQRERGLRLVRLAAALQYCLPGVPCIYYGDEAGMEGYGDPFNRGCYPWGREERELLLWYRKLGQLRRIAPALREGRFTPLNAPESVVCFERRDGSAALLCAVNRSEQEQTAALPAVWQNRTVNLGGGRVEADTLILPPLDCAILVDNTPEEPA